MRLKITLGVSYDSEVTTSQRIDEIKWTKGKIGDGFLILYPKDMFSLHSVLPQ